MLEELVDAVGQLNQLNGSLATGNRYKHPPAASPAGAIHREKISQILLAICPRDSQITSRGASLKSIRTL
jgi:hypothetical protein